MCLLYGFLLSPAATGGWLPRQWYPEAAHTIEGYQGDLIQKNEELLISGILLPWPYCQLHASLSTTLGRYNTPLSPTDKSSKQKLNRERLEPMDIISQMDLTYLHNVSPRHPI